MKTYLKSNVMKFTSSFYKERIEKNKKETEHFNAVKEKYIKYRYDAQRITL